MQKIKAREIMTIMCSTDRMRLASMDLHVDVIVEGSKGYGLCRLTLFETIPKFGKEETISNDWFLTSCDT